jgi:hypothetical protein
VIEQRLFRAVTFIRWAEWQPLLDRCAKQYLITTL